MLANVNLSTATTLYSSSSNIFCHCVRIIMEEKGIQSNKYFIEQDRIPEDIIELNPYNMLPILFDRQMVLYDFVVISEYLDERFPFPPLMSVDPIERAQKRLLLFRFTRAENSLFALAQRILTPSNKKDADKARKILTNHLIDLVPLFDSHKYFKSDNFTILDVCMSVLLWRLDKMAIKLPSSAKAINNYANRLFARSKFKDSLSDMEREFH